MQATQLMTRNAPGQTKREKIEYMIFRFGYRPDLKGFKFLADAIMELSEDRNLIFGITKKLYPAIARKNETSVSAVERGIRLATDKAWGDSHDSSLRALFVERAQKPTNRRVLAILVQYFELLEKSEM